MLCRHHQLSKKLICKLQIDILGFSIFFSSMSAAKNHVSFLFLEFQDCMNTFAAMFLESARGTLPNERNDEIELSYHLLKRLLWIAGVDVRVGKRIEGVPSHSLQVGLLSK